MIAINMEMPKSCGKCPFRATFPNTGLKNGVCNDLHLPFKRHPYCPLTEIVTCCDCIYGVFGECKKFHHYTMKDDFCNFGKRRE